MRAERRGRGVAVALLGCCAASAAEGGGADRDAERRTHQESAREHAGASPPAIPTPPLPPGMTLDEVLDHAGRTPAEDLPDPVMDDTVFAWTLIEQLEYRVPDDASPAHLGWEAQGWIGGDRHRFWWKHEGEFRSHGEDGGETETDLLYSRPITPFWHAQAGVQWANEWQGDDDEDRWSAVVAFQGLAPYHVEVDASLYLSEDGDLSLDLEAEYDLRITQRLVLQPRLEAAVHAQDIPERDLGAGLSRVALELRLRYEILRRLAPYLGVRHTSLIGGTRNRAEDEGQDTGETMLLFGLLLAF